jgi:NTP pyrophosphatase (non-canonical NTP hydrolase)
MPNNEPQTYEEYLAGYHGMMKPYTREEWQRRFGRMPNQKADVVPEETEQSINEWQLATFGPAPNLMRTAARANEEMAELLTALSLNQTDKIGEEIADIILVLHCITGHLGISIRDEVNKKMKINRERKWNVTDPGHGYHK